MRFVVDASMALAWVLQDERTPVALAVRDMVGESPILVPLPWPLEVATALTHACLRNRISRIQMEECLDDLREMDVYVAQEPYWPCTGAQIESMLSHRMTGYDWAYIRLAQQYDLPLLTLDEPMALAARRMGVAVPVP